MILAKLAVCKSVKGAVLEEMLQVVDCKPRGTRAAQTGNSLLAPVYEQDVLMQNILPFYACSVRPVAW